MSPGSQVAVGCLLERLMQDGSICAFRIVSELREVQKSGRYIAVTYGPTGVLHCVLSAREGSPLNPFSPHHVEGPRIWRVVEG